MFNKKQLVIISLILGILFHFLYHFNLYGPQFNILQSPIKYIFAFGSIFIMIFLYLGTYWRTDLMGSITRWVYDLFVTWIIICFIRSLVEIQTSRDILTFLFTNYMGLSLFPVLFFIVGLNARYFFSVNKILFTYFILAAILSFFFLSYFEFELQHFLLLHIFYIIIIIPLCKHSGKLLIILISISIVASSLTNRAEIIRITTSYLIIVLYYLLYYKKINKKFVYTIVFLLLMIPIVSLYLGIQGQSVFQIMSIRDTGEYSQLDPYADTRTFLYYEIFQDLKLNESFLFGKGLNAGYYSESFNTLSRPIVEVGFLQIILKTGIVGFLLFIIVIISSIIKALGRSKNLFIKSLGLLLSIYTIMLFIENILAYNILNIVIWIVIGMCQSVSLRSMNDHEIVNLFNGKA